MSSRTASVYTLNSQTDSLSSIIFVQLCRSAKINGMITIICNIPRSYGNLLSLCPAEQQHLKADYLLLLINVKTTVKIWRRHPHRCYSLYHVIDLHLSNSTSLIKWVILLWVILAPPLTTVHGLLTSESREKVVWRALMINYVGLVCYF